MQRSMLSRAIAGLLAATAVAVPAADVAALFADATQLTFFVDEGVTYQLAVKPQLPGSSC